MLEITKIVRKRSIDQTGVLCIVLHVGDLVLVLNRRDCLLAKNRQSLMLMDHSRLLIYSLEMLFNPALFSTQVSAQKQFDRRLQDVASFV